MIANCHLFSIPIYSFSKEECEKRYRIFIDKQVPKFYESEERLKKTADARAVLRPKDVWLYNQIIGYIRVSLANQDVLFEVYMPLGRKRYQAFSNRKSYMENWHLNGYHFRFRDMSNEQITHEIREWLVAISKIEGLKRWHVDITVFDDIAKFIDFRALINDTQKED